MWMLVPLAALAYLAAQQLKRTQESVGRLSPPDLPASGLSSGLPASGLPASGRVSVLLQLPTLTPAQARGLLLWARQDPSVSDLRIRLAESPASRTTAHVTLRARSKQLKPGEPVLLGPKTAPVPAMLLSVGPAAGMRSR